MHATGSHCNIVKIWFYQSNDLTPVPKHSIHVVPCLKLPRQRHIPDLCCYFLPVSQKICNRINFGTSTCFQKQPAEIFEELFACFIVNHLKLDWLHGWLRNNTHSLFVLKNIRFRMFYLYLDSELALVSRMSYLNEFLLNLRPEYIKHRLHINEPTTSTW